jgi:glycosyltransferase involved in cell wall biosynthesis
LEIAAALLGFHRRANPGRNRVLFDLVLLPWMNHAMDADQYETALVLEHIVYGAYISQTESKEFFSGELAKWRDPMREAGRRFAASLPPTMQPGAIRPGPPQILFFVHVLNLLAHVRQLLEVVSAIRALDPRPFEPVIVTLKIEDQRLAEQLRSAGLSLVEIRLEGAMPVSQALHRLRDEVRNRNAVALVWISLVDLMCFAFGMRLAKTQIWWAMKYHGLQFPEIDGYLTGGSIAGGRKRIDEQEWRVGPVLATDLLDTGADGDVSAIRARYPAARIVFGCFGREEKLTDAAFLNAVCEILAKVPDSVFLWTGRNQHPAVQHAFDARGVAGRCHFIGWVNTRQYARVIDVFLDSFPFPCGYTLYEAMAAGRPVVLYSSPESDQTGLHAIVSPLLFGADGGDKDRTELRSIFRHEQHGNLYLRAGNPEEYVDFAARLANDEQFRMGAGEASRRFVDRFMLNRERTGRIYAQHFMEILAVRAGNGLSAGTQLRS